MCKPASRLPGEQGSTALRSVLWCSVLFLLLLPCHSVVLGAGSRWTQKSPCAGRPASLLPPFRPRGQHSSHPPRPCPVLAAAFQLPAPPEDSVPVGPAGGERWRLGTPGSGHGAGRLPSVNNTVFASQALPGLSLGPAGSPSCCGPGVSGGGEHNPPCVFQAARLLSESGLSQELARPPPAHPDSFQSKGRPLLQAAPCSH